MDSIHGLVNVLAFIAVCASALIGYKVQAILFKLKIPERMAVVEDKQQHVTSLLVGLKDRVTIMENRELEVIKSMIPREEYQIWHKQIQDKVDANYLEIGRKIDDLRNVLLGLGVTIRKSE